MNVNVRRQTSTLALLCMYPLLVMACGCATFEISGVQSEGLSDQSRQRNKEVTREFEQNRDFAEFQAAWACWKRNDTNGCEESLQRLLQRNPDHCDGRLLMADVCMEQNRPQAALEQVEHAVRKHPDDAGAKYAMALLLDSIGKTETALAYYEQAAVAEPKNKVFVVGYRSAMEARGKTTNPAGSMAPQVSPVNPSAGGIDAAGFEAGVDVASIKASIARGVDALRRGKSSEAGEYFREAAGLAPDNPHIPAHAAVLALRLNQPALAIELLQPAARLFPGSAKTFRILGVAQYRLGDYKSSQVSLQQALSLDKSSALAYFLMGCTLSKLGQSESAEAHFEQARTMHSKYAVRR
jgi:tetratricopeptide (TPR) repeat protein